MTTSPLSEVLRRLPLLSREDLLKVRHNVEAIVGATKPQEEPEANRDWLLEGLTAELRRRGLWVKKHSIPKDSIPTTYAKTAEGVREHLIAGCNGEDMRYVEKLALARAAASALADYLSKINVPVTPNTLLHHTRTIPLALEESFPGYWASKMLRSCVEGHL